MKQFTDLLDEYLEARVSRYFDRQDGSFYSTPVGQENYEAARDALNEAFEQMKGEKSE